MIKKKILPTNSTPNQAVPKLLSPIQTPKESSQPTSDETCSNDEGFKFVKHSKKKIKHSKKTKKESEIKIVMCAANKNMAKLWFERASELMQLPMPKPENIKGLGDINNINHYTYISKLSKSQLKVYKEHVDNLSHVNVIGSYDVGKDITYLPKLVIHCSQCCDHDPTVKYMKDT